MRHLPAWLAALLLALCANCHHAHAGPQDGPDGVDPLGLSTNPFTYTPKYFVTISDSIIGFHFEGEEPRLYTPAQAPSMTECVEGCRDRQWKHPGCYLQEVIAYEDSTGQPCCKCIWLCVRGDNVHV